MLKLSLQILLAFLQERKTKNLELLLKKTANLQLTRLLPLDYFLSLESSSNSCSTRCKTIVDIMVSLRGVLRLATGDSIFLLGYLNWFSGSRTRNLIWLFGLYQIVI